MTSGSSRRIGEFFHATLGRPSIPIETYLRLMFLKFRYRLGFETLCREVTDSIGWQRFCRIPLGGRVPHPTTLMKITPLRSGGGGRVEEAIDVANGRRSADVVGVVAAGGGAGDAGRAGTCGCVVGRRPLLRGVLEFFHATLGRPSIPIETYLRLMFLKYRYRLGFETLCREVTDSITWQRFCRIPLGGRVPHPTTLMKITTRCGETAVNGLNEALLAKAVEARVLKTNRVRADTTVIEANVAYPSDSSLLAKGVAKMAAGAKKLKTMGLATRTRLADKTRTVRSRARSINANLRRRTDDKLAEVQTDQR